MLGIKTLNENIERQSDIIFILKHKIPKDGGGRELKRWKFNEVLFTYLFYFVFLKKNWLKNFMYYKKMKISFAYFVCTCISVNFIHLRKPYCNKIFIWHLSVSCY